MGTTANLNSTTPAAASGTINTTYQNDGSGNISSSVPIATTSALGVVQPDGVTIDVSSGVISVPTATTSVSGLVKPDGSSITISSGVISASGGFSNPMTTEGDIIYGGSSGTPTRLAAGTSGYILQTNGSSSAPTWVANTGGGGGMTLIASQVLSTTTASVTFSSIPGTYNILQVVGFGRVGGSSYNEFINVQFNGDTSAHYIDEILYGKWTNSPVATTSGNGATALRLFALTAGNSTGNYAGSFTFSIPGYANTSFYKQANGQGSFTDTGASGGVETYTTAGQWISTAAITSIKLFGADSFTTGTSFYLYGY